MNLLCHLNRSITDCDFSRLALWQVDLRAVNLYNCNLAEADLSQVLLADDQTNDISYAGTNIFSVKGLTEAQRSALLKLGAIEAQLNPQPSTPELNLSQETRDRLQQINASTKDLVNWAALLGMQFDPTQLADLADCSLTTLLTAMEELEQHQIIYPIELVTGEVGYAFTEDEVRQWIKAQISEPRRRLMQRHITQRFPNA